MDVCLGTRWMFVLEQDGCLSWDKMDVCPGSRWMFGDNIDVCQDKMAVLEQDDVLGQDGCLSWDKMAVCSGTVLGKDEC